MENDLFYKRKNIHDTDISKSEIFNFCEGYKAFLKECTTERKCVSYFIAKAEKNGFLPFEKGKEYKKGDKVYFNNRDKSVIFAVMGNDIENGLSIAAAHIDSPRLDLRPNPLYESDGIAFLSSHYYGGIKKYQWTAIPLKIDGVVVLKDNKVVDLSDDTLTFTISDLLPHVAKDQLEKPLASAIDGEMLKIICGNMPSGKESENERVKAYILNLLNEKYGITEKDFLTAEICFVPKIEPSDIGFDKSLIGAYGQDDRVCAYTAFEGLIKSDAPDKCKMLILADKEETGSDGVSGMQSQFFEYAVKKLAKDKDLYEIFNNSVCLSADVGAAYDPLYPNQLDKQNNAHLGCGTCITKYTGVGGKSQTSDASAELMRYFADMFEKNDIIYQSSLFGKVDLGGGGTVAKYIANRNIDTVDLGVPLLSMHSPFEISSKVDVYMTFKAFEVFLK